MPSNLCPKNCLATCVYDAKPGALPGLLNRALKESYSEEKACKNRNVLEGWSFKTALFQQPVNLRAGVSSYLTARHPAAGYYSFGQLNELACPWFFAVKRVSRKEGTDQGRAFLWRKFVRGVPADAGTELIEKPAFIKGRYAR